MRKRITLIIILICLAFAAFYGFNTLKKYKVIRGKGSATERDFGQEDFLKELMSLKEKDGRDNALIHYVAASRKIPRIPDPTQEGLITDVLDQGWDKKAKGLRRLISSFKPVFKEIRKGASLDYAMGIGWERGPSTPVPNFLAVQVSSKMLCVEGRYFESKKRYTDALDNYLTALTMGRDYTAPEGTLISNLVGIAIQTIALKQIYHLANSGNLDRRSLDRLLNRLEVIEETQGSAANAFRGEANTMKWVFEKIRTEPEEARKMLNEGVQLEINPEDVINQVDRIEAEHNRFWDFQIRFIETPYWNRDPVAHARNLELMIDSFHPLLKEAMPNFLQADVRFLITKTYLLETQLATALAAYKIDTGMYPEQLTALAPIYLESMPIDPFGGRQFQYDSSSDGTSYILYSIGPDRRDDGGRVPYDPKKGTMSGGDVMLK